MKRMLVAVLVSGGLASPLAAQETGFVWDGRPTLRAGDWLRVDFRARFQGDVRKSEVAPEKDEDLGLDIARRRVGIEGRLGRVLGFQVEYETSVGAWRDVYADYRQFDAVRIRAGKFKLPFGLDETTSATDLDFVYRSRIGSRLAPGRDVGVMAHGRVSGAVRYEAGIFRHDGDNARPSTASARVFGNRTTAARVTVEPFHKSDSPYADLQFGAALSTATLDEGFPSVRARTVLGASFFDSDVWVKGRRQRTGLQARWRPGSAAIQAEYIRLTDQRRGQSVDDIDLSPLLAAGWYVSGMWVVTGEHKSRGLDKPRHRFGAIELATRIESIHFGSAASRGDPSSSRRADNVLGNSDHALTFGVNWHLNRWVKVQANFIRERIDNPSMGPLPERAAFWSRVFRVQLTL